jgi:tetratricopeptide (TPR) repeat protein
MEIPVKMFYPPNRRFHKPAALKPWRILMSDRHVLFGSLLLRVAVLSFFLTTVSAIHAQSNNMGVTPQQMLQGVDPQTAQQFNAASAAIQRSPNDANALVTRAQIALNISQRSPYSYQWVHLAALDLEKALRLDPKNFYALHDYAMAYFNAGDGSDAQTNMHQAVALFTRALQINPNSARTYMGRGWAYLMLDDEAHADADFQKTLQLDPSLSGDLTQQANAIRQKRAQKGCVQGMIQRMGSYVVDNNARTANQCAAHKGYWTGSECRISTAMAPGPLALGSQDAATGNRGQAGGCVPPRDAVDDRYIPRLGGSVVK